MFFRKFIVNLPLNMSKHTFSHIIFSYLLALLFFFAGTGYNLVIYCCSDCKKAGMDTVAATSCECIHHHHHHANGEVHADHDVPPHLCDFLAHHQKSCEFQRLTVDTPTFSNAVFNFDEVHFPTMILFAVAVPDFSPQESAPLHYLPLPPNLSPPLTGREILAEHSLLLI